MSYDSTLDAVELDVISNPSSTNLNLQDSNTKRLEYVAPQPTSDHIEDLTYKLKTNTKDGVVGNHSGSEKTSKSGKETPSTNSFSSDDGQSIWDLKVAIILCIITSFSGFIFGWDVGTIGGISNMSAFKDHFGTVENVNGNGREFPALIIGLIISIFNIGCAIGGLSLSRLGDVLGRKWGILSFIAIYILGVVVQITSSAWVQFFVGRIITGLSIGGTSVLTPMFISEVAPLKIRGAMVVFYQLMITLGILLGNVVNFICKRLFEIASDNLEWRIPIGLCFVWSFIIIVGILFMPESPIYLINIAHDEEKALKSIAKLNNKPVNDLSVLQQVDDIVDTYHRSKQQEQLQGVVKWHEFITGEPKLFLRLIIGVAIMFFQQFSGANYFFYYGTTLFNSVGIEDSYITSIILGGVNFISTFGGIYFVEKFGRRLCLLMGSLGMFICMVIYSSLGSFANLETSTIPGGFMILFTCVYIFFFATTWGPVAFVVVSEIYPTRVKNISMSLSTSVNWFANFLISLFTPYITNIIGFKYGYVFSFCLLASGIFVFTVLPETKGLNIDDIDALYTKAQDEEEVVEN